MFPSAKTFSLQMGLPCSECIDSSVEAVAWWGQNSSQACKIINILLLSLYMSISEDQVSSGFKSEERFVYAFCFYLERLKWQHVWASPFVSPKYYCVYLVCCSFIMFYVRTVYVYGTERSLDHSLFRCIICLFFLTALYYIFVLSHTQNFSSKQ